MALTSFIATTDHQFHSTVLKTTYKNDPLFKNTKTVFTIYNNSFTYKFKGDLMGKVKMIDIEDNMLGHLKRQITKA
jgi:hypothetical protein